MSFTHDSSRRIARVVIDAENAARDLTRPPRVQRTPLPFQFRRFELAEAFSMNSERDETYQTAEAYFLKDDGTVEDGTSATDRPPFIVTDILNTRFGLGNGELDSPYDRGSQGTCYHPHDVDRWEVVDMRAIDMMRFELKDDLPPGGTVDAYYLDSVGSIQSGVVFEVTDVLGVHRGRQYASSEVRGSQGYAWYMHDLQRFEILKIQPHALRISGEAAADVYYDDEEFTLTGEPVIMNPTGAIALHDYTTTDLIKNPLGLQFANGDTVHAEWNEEATTPQWEAVDVGRPRPHRITGTTSGAVLTSTETFTLTGDPVIINPVDAISEEDYTAADLIKNPYGLEFAEAATVFIEYNITEEEWEVVGPSSETHQARWLNFTASANFLTGGTISIDGRTYYDGMAPETDITSILNPMGLTGYDDCTGIAIINTNVSPPTYTAIVVKPVAEEVITDYNVNTSTFKLQKKTRDLSVMPRGDESDDWVDIHTGDDCE